MWSSRHTVIIQPFRSYICFQKDSPSVFETPLSLWSSFSIVETRLSSCSHFFHNGATFVIMEPLLSWWSLVCHGGATLVKLNTRLSWWSNFCHLGVTFVILDIYS